MYLFPEMINIGLKEGQSWPSDAHKAIATRIAIANPEVTNKDTLTEIVSAVLSVPENRVKKVTFADLVKDFGCPNVQMSEYMNLQSDNGTGIKYVSQGMGGAS